MDNQENTVAALAIDAMDATVEKEELKRRAWQVFAAILFACLCACLGYIFFLTRQKSAPVPEVVASSTSTVSDEKSWLMQSARPTLDALDRYRLSQPDKPTVKVPSSPSIRTDSSQVTSDFTLRRKPVMPRGKKTSFPRGHVIPQPKDGPSEPAETAQTSTLGEQWPQLCFAGAFKKPIWDTESFLEAKELLVGLPGKPDRESLTFASSFTDSGLPPVDSSKKLDLLYYNRNAACMTIHRKVNDGKYSYHLLPIEPLGDFLLFHATITFHRGESTGDGDWYVVIPFSPSDRLLVRGRLSRDQREPMLSIDRFSDSKFTMLIDQEGTWQSDKAFSLIVAIYPKPRSGLNGALNTDASSDVEQCISVAIDGNTEVDGVPTGGGTISGVGLGAGDVALVDFDNIIATKNIWGAEAFNWSAPEVINLRFADRK